jgi:hypothetical protein
MNPIEDLVHEHKAIKVMLSIMNKIAENIRNDQSVDTNDIEGIVDFLKTFADKCHHGKEENALFPALVEAGIPKEGLKNPIFLPTASYGHFGRDHYVKDVEVYYEGPDCKRLVVKGNGKKVYTEKVEFFAWEKLDYVDKIRKAFLL